MVRNIIQSVLNHPFQIWHYLDVLHYNLRYFWLRQKWQQWELLPRARTLMAKLIKAVLKYWYLLYL